MMERRELSREETRLRNEVQYLQYIELLQKIGEFRKKTSYILEKLPMSKDANNL